MCESERWKIVNSKISPGVMVYDKLLDKVAVDIASGNKQIDEIMARVCFECIHNSDFLADMMRRFDLK